MCKKIDELMEENAKLKAERDEWVTAFWKTEKRLETAQVQLAKTVGLLRNLAAAPASHRLQLIADVKAFLNHHTSTIEES